MHRISVIGGGMVGSLIYHELSINHECRLYDLNASNSIPFNILTDDLNTLLPVDLIVLAVPGNIGYKALERLIPLGKPIVDISFFPEDPSTLKAELRKNGNSLIHDCGVAPGFDNIALGHYTSRYSIEKFRCLVGGLPLEKNPPINYKAPFSPSDVIEEYVRPARFRRDGKNISMDALTEIELIKHHKYGELEAFNSDGLRSLLESFPDIPNMVEKTLRYPGHAQQMALLREAGFFESEMLELTSKRLFKLWELKPDDPEFTLMLIDIESKDGKKIGIELSAERNDEGWSSMTQTTGYNCTAAVEWTLKNPKLDPGLYSPEKLGAIPSYWDFLLDYLKGKGISIQITES